jgi:hypothetical protein
VRRAMTKRDGARRVADGFEASGGPVTAADAFEEQARARSAGAGARSAADRSAGVR